jgi:CBS domain-containing protein
MNVEQIYRPDVFGVAISDSLEEAASTMHFNEVGALPVFDDGRLVGILSERDVVRAVAEGVVPQETAAGDYMTSDPSWVTPETSVQEASDRMLQLGVRHLPVLLGANVVGMVSMRDLLIDSPV